MKINMRTLTVASLASFMFACGPFNPVTVKEIEGVTYHLESPRDPQCYHDMLKRAMDFNVRWGIFGTKPMSVKGLNVWIHDGDSFWDYSWVEKEDIELWGQETVIGDKIELAEHGYAFAHELLHRYNAFIRHRKLNDELHHFGWEGDEGWYAKTDRFYWELTNNNISCPVDESFRNHYQVR